MDFPVVLTGVHEFFHVFAERSAGIQAERIGRTQLRNLFRIEFQRQFAMHVMENGIQIPVKGLFHSLQPGIRIVGIVRNIRNIIRVFIVRPIRKMVLFIHSFRYYPGLLGDVLPVHPGTNQDGRLQRNEVAAIDEDGNQ